MMNNGRYLTHKRVTTKQDKERPRSITQQKK